MYVYIDIHVYYVAHLLKSHSPKSPKMMVFLRMVWDSSPKCPWNAWPQQVQPSGSLRPAAATTAGHPSRSVAGPNRPDPPGSGRTSGFGQQLPWRPGQGEITCTIYTYIQFTCMYLSILITYKYIKI